MLLMMLFLLLVNVLISANAGSPEAPASKRGLIAQAALAGAIVGLMALTRYSMGWLIFPVVIFLASVAAPARIQAALGAVIIFALLLGPWVGRNLLVSGTFFGTAGYAIHQETSAFSGFLLDRSMPKDVVLLLNKVELNQYPRKIFVNGRDILSNELPRAAGNWISALFFGALLIPFRNVAIRQLRYFAVGTILLFVIVQALGKTALSGEAAQLNTENLLVVFTPLIFIFGAGMFFVFMDQVVLPAPWVRTIAVIGNVFGQLSTWG